MKIDSETVTGAAAGRPPLETAVHHVLAFPITWLQDQLEPNGQRYNVPTVVRLMGPLLPEILELSLNEIIHRIEAPAASSQPANNNRLRQTIKSDVKIALVIWDLSSLPEASREEEARRLTREEAQRPFALNEAPVVRSILFRLAEDDHALIFNPPPLISDTWNPGVLLRELASIYEAFLAGGTSILPELAVHSSNSTACWREEREILDSKLTNSKYQLAGALPCLQLPMDYPRPLSATFSGSQQTLILPKALLDSVQKLCHDKNVPLFTTLLAVLNVLLMRYTGQEDVVVGTPVSVRTCTEAGNPIGFVSNTLLIRTNQSSDPSFCEFLARVHEAVTDAFAHQDLSFKKPIEGFKPQEDLSCDPLIKVIFALQGITVEGTNIASTATTTTCFSTVRQCTNLDLAFLATQAPDGLRTSIIYNTELFEAITIKRMIRHYLGVLEAVVAHPEQCVSQIPMLTAEEEERLLVEWNNTSEEYPRDSCIHELFERQAAQTPEHVAVIVENRRLTYQELNLRANQLAHHLRAHGVSAETLVGICLERSLEMVVAILGVLKAGGAYVPLDPTYPSSRIAFMLQDTRASVLITHTSLGVVKSPHRAFAIYFDQARPQIANEPKQNLCQTACSGNLAYVIYTSGSTGQPKGVLGLHRGAVNRFCWMWRRYPFFANEVALHITSFNFIDSVWALFGPLLQGVPVVLMPSERYDAMSLLRAMEDQRITRITLVPSLLQAIADASREYSAEIPSGAIWIASGEPLSASTCSDLSTQLSSVRILNIYGSSEVSADATCYEWTAKPNVNFGSVSIGKPISNMRAYILDRQLRPVPVGVAGDLYLGGDGLARGYHNRPDLTAERFICDPFSQQPGARLYKTGDRARFHNDGNIEYLGRTDNQIKIRGLRIELGEIESVLGQHPDIEKAVVVGADRDGDKRLVAYVIPKENRDAKSAGLRAFLERKIPRHMVPAIFIKLQAFPLTENGKINRRALPEPDWSNLDGSNKIAPSDGLELTLVRVWERVLGVSNINRDDDFFDLGGHSMLAVKLISEVERVVGQKIPLASLFQAKTVASLAQLLRSKSDSTLKPLVIELQSGDANPPFFAVAAPGVRTLGYALVSRYLGEHQPFYTLQANGPLVQDRPVAIEELRALAHQYISGMLAVQKHGPFYLGGMCDGARIAEQMILELEAQGQRVDLFAVFDTWVLEHTMRPWLSTLNYYWQRLRTLRKAGLPQQLQWLRGAVKRRIVAVINKTAPQTIWKETFWPENFTPSCFCAPIALFKRPKQPIYRKDDPLLGWGSRAKGGVEVHEIGVGHFEHLQILREPYVHEVSVKLAQCMQRARNRAEGTTER